VILPVAPESPLDLDGPRPTPRFGTYRGSARSVDLSPLAADRRDRVQSWVRLKRWQYAIVATEEVLVAWAVVDLNYASNAFVFAVDLRESTRIFDRGFLGLPALSARVGDRPADGARSRFRSGSSQLAFDWTGARGTLTARTDGLHLDARLDFGPVTPLTVIAPVPDGVVNFTQKVALIRTSGSLSVGDRRYDLTGGFAGLDYTHGLLARRTDWRWAFGIGRSEDGRPVGFNRVEGFNAASDADASGENAVWTDDGVFCTPPCEFQWNAAQTLDPWSLRGDGTDLAFAAAGEHREERHLGVIDSRFIQVAGRFSGELAAAGRTIAVHGLPGVTEDQRVRW
jgi:hypothetical protein